MRMRKMPKWQDVQMVVVDVLQWVRCGDEGCLATSDADKDKCQGDGMGLSEYGGCHAMVVYAWVNLQLNVNPLA